MFVVGYIFVAHVLAEGTPHSVSARILVRCRECSKYDKRCNKKFPCFHCTKAGKICIIGLDEIDRRIKDLDRKIREGELVLDEFALSLMNAEAIRSHRRKLFKRTEQVKVLDQVRAQYPIVPNLNVVPSLINLPENIRSLIEGQELWRVEWFLKGMIVGISSDRWMRNLYYPARTFSVKIVEMGNFCEWSTMIQLWSDSLVYPGRLVYKEGLGFSDEYGIRRQRASVLSHVYDYDHVVSVMVIQRL
jgi:hypothetical protein